VKRWACTILGIAVGAGASLGLCLTVLRQGTAGRRGAQVTPQDSVKPPTINGLQVTLATSQPEYQLGQPMVVTVTFKNVAARQQDIILYADLGGRVVLGENLLVCGKHEDGSDIPVLVMRPSLPVRVRIPLLRDSWCGFTHTLKELEPSKPGLCTLRAVYAASLSDYGATSKAAVQLGGYCWTGQVESNPVMVRVAESR